MTTQLLSRQGAPRRAELPFLGDLTLALARVHEFCGPARRSLAAILAGRTEGVVFWIQPAWLPERINGEALARLADPARVIFLFPRRPEDLLWTTEEALRPGAVPLVIADLPFAPALTPVRRLHLAAEAGAAAGRKRPLGVILTPGDGGAQGVESRWHLAPDHAAAAGEGWRLSRRRARSDPPRDWRMTAEGPTGWRLAPAP